VTWAKIDDRFPRHPKVLRVGGDAAWLYVAGLCYANEHLTDGRIPALAVPTLTDRKRPMELAEKLVSVRLWERDGEDFLIHDYHDENDTADMVRAKREALSAKRRAAGVEGGRRSGETRRALAMQGESGQKSRAVSLVNLAIKRGDLVRGACEVCGSAESHGHHDDYSKPLKVRWLCSLHQSEEHAQQRSKQATKQRSNLLHSTKQPTKQLSNPDADADADVYFSLSRDPSATGSGHGLQAQPRVFSAGDVERLYSEVTSKTAHPQACAPVAQAIVAAAASKACDPTDLTRKVFVAFPAYRAHCKTLGWDVHPSLRGVEAHIDRLLLWLDGEKPVGQQPSRSQPQPTGPPRPVPEEKLPPMYRPSVPIARRAP
jgi:hypothetical protein